MKSLNLSKIEKVSPNDLKPVKSTQVRSFHTVFQSIHDIYHLSIQAQMIRNSNQVPVGYEKFDNVARPSTTKTVSVEVSLKSFPIPTSLYD